MIVKNEAQNIGPCIRSVKAAIDEIIVVDTGSTDNTKEIARQLGAKVYDFPWCDDFGAARNESIRHATKDYILWLDADDRMDKSDVKKIGNLKKMLDPKKDKAYYLVINSQSPVDGETLFQQLRIFPNIKGAAFEGRIHEQIFHILGAMGVQFVKTDIVIRHIGYQDASTVVKKAERNLKIIEKELETNPDHLILHYNAARTLSGIGRHAEAVCHIKRVTDDENIKENDKPFFLAAALLLGKHHTDVGQYEEAVSVYRDLASDSEENGLIHYCLGQALYLVKDYHGAIDELQRSLLLPIEVSLFPTNLEGVCYYQYYTLGECYSAIGEKDRAKEMFQESLNFSSDHQKSLAALGLRALENQQYEEAIQYYERAIQEGIVSDQIYSNLGLSYRKLGRSAEAEKAFLKALEVNPQRTEALTNLGHLYHQKKEYSKAIDCFNKALDLAPNLMDVRFALSEIYFRLHELEKLVQECDALRRDLALSCEMTLNSFEELSGLYEEMGGVLSEKGRDDLSLMSYRTSFLIHPTKRVLDKIIPVAKSSNILNHYLADIEEILTLHGGESQGVGSHKEVLARPF
jgi:tetratricopeptide (TPR) repeat protein